MINLIPDDVKRDIGAARMNVLLLRYNLLTLAAMVVLIGIGLAFYVYLSSTQTSALATSEDNKAKAASFNDVRAAADEYKNNLTIARQIFDNGVNYTSVVFAITELLPNGVVLDSVDLTTSSFGQQTTFSAHAKTYEKATELKNNFQESDVFSNVYLQNLADGSDAASGVTSEYPIAVTISAKLEKVTD